MADRVEPRGEEIAKLLEEIHGVVLAHDKKSVTSRHYLSKRLKGQTLTNPHSNGRILHHQEQIYHYPYCTLLSFVNQQTVLCCITNL